jgi:hypothetical protein
MDLHEKLGVLNPNKYEKRDADIVNGWKDRVIELTEQKDFKDHPVTRRLAQEAKMQIETIENILKNTEELSETERRALFKEKKVHQLYLSLFTRDPNDELQLIEEQVDQEIGL